MDGDAYKIKRYVTNAHLSNYASRRVYAEFSKSHKMFSRRDGESDLQGGIAKTLSGLFVNNQRK